MFRSCDGQNTFVLVLGVSSSIDVRKAMINQWSVLDKKIGTYRVQKLGHKRLNRNIYHG